MGTMHVGGIGVVTVDECLETSLITWDVTINLQGWEWRPQMGPFYPNFRLHDGGRQCAELSIKNMVVI